MNERAWTATQVRWQLPARMAGERERDDEDGRATNHTNMCGLSPRSMKRCKAIRRGPFQQLLSKAFVRFFWELVSNILSTYLCVRVLCSLCVLPFVSVWRGSVFTGPLAFALACCLPYGSFSHRQGRPTTTHKLHFWVILGLGVYQENIRASQVTGWILQVVCHCVCY